jgi:predicted small metal-binding protein
MMKLACKDINSTTECNFEVTGDTAVEVASKMMAHAKVDHAKDIAGMPDEAVLEMMESKVHA